MKLLSVLLKLKRKYKDLIQIKTIHNDENLGYPVGINCGLEHCKGEIITILNNDLVFPENWFDGLVKTIENDSTIGAVAAISLVWIRSSTYRG